MKTWHIPYLTLWLALLATVLGLLLPSRLSLAQVGPNIWFFEIDGDDKIDGVDEE
jgi:hypothetical protein